MNAGEDKLPIITKPYLPKEHLIKLLEQTNESVELDVFEESSAGPAVARLAVGAIFGVDHLIIHVLNPYDYALVIVGGGSHGVRCTAILFSSLFLGEPSRIVTGSAPEWQIMVAEWGEHDAEMISKFLKAIDAVTHGKISFKKVEEDAEAYLEKALKERSVWRRLGLNRLNALGRRLRI